MLHTLLANQYRPSSSCSVAYRTNTTSSSLFGKKKRCENRDDAKRQRRRVVVRNPKNPLDPKPRGIMSKEMLEMKFT